MLLQPGTTLPLLLLQGFLNLIRRLLKNSLLFKAVYIAVTGAEQPTSAVLLLLLLLTESWNLDGADLGALAGRDSIFDDCLLNPY